MCTVMDLSGATKWQLNHLCCVYISLFSIKPEMNEFVFCGSGDPKRNQSQKV